MAAMAGSSEKEMAMLPQQSHHALNSEGFMILPGFLNATRIEALTKHCRALTQKEGGSRAGVRNLLGADATISQFSQSGDILAIAREVLGAGAIPVRVILFDKSPEANWGVPWHQDLNVAVSGDSHPPGYGPRTVKQGIPHIVPTRTILENMLTLRLHLAPCTLDDGPLVVAPGSHRAGIVSIHSNDCARFDSIAVACPAEVGDLLVMRPLLFHRSSRAKNPTGRMVLHIEYAAAQLDGDLRWFYHSEKQLCSEATGQTHGGSAPP